MTSRGTLYNYPVIVLVSSLCRYRDTRGITRKYTRACGLLFLDSNLTGFFPFYVNMYGPLYITQYTTILKKTDKPHLLVLNR